MRYFVLLFLLLNNVYSENKNDSELNKIIIPKFRFTAPVKDAFEYLERRSKDLYKKKGLVIKYIPQKGSRTIVDLDLDNIPVADILHYICLTTNLNYTIKGNIVTVTHSKKKNEKFKKTIIKKNFTSDGMKKRLQSPFPETDEKGADSAYLKFYYRQMSRSMDPGKLPMNIVFASSIDKKVDLKFKKTNLKEAILALAKAFDLEIRIDEHAIVIGDKNILNR